MAGGISLRGLVIVEVPDDDAKPAVIRNVIDGDTVELSGGIRVRLVGYDAYELSEPLGALARQELRSLCLGEAYLDVDDLEPQDRYGRILGYLWCRRGAGNVTWYVSVQKHFIVGDGRRYVKQLLYIPPDEHPPTLWAVRHVVKFNTAVEIYVYNDTKSPHKIYGDAVVLTSGVYEVYYGGQLAARLRLMSHTPNTTTINLPTANTTAGAAQRVTVTVTQTATRTVTTTTTQTVTSTTTSIRILPLTETKTAIYVVTRTSTTIVVVEKPYVHPITYVVIAAAVAAAVLAAYITRRSRTTTQL
jgi:endonuclease YncB( thermonuclease family)